jgi:DNA-binding response OmpR family regulator
MPDRILVIEDDGPTRYAYERALARTGYRTQGYASYFEAAEDIDHGAGALLVVDLQLPPRTPNGLAVAHEWRGSIVPVCRSFLSPVIRSWPS